MKLEFLEDGSPDSPLIRLYAFDQAQATWLHGIFLSLAYGGRDDVALQYESNVEPIDGCHLTLRLAQRDAGIVRCEGSTFECQFTSVEWEAIASLVEPFCESVEPNRYQWLTETGDAYLLLSSDGSW